MDFRSDNVGICAPPILDAIVAANRGAHAPYGADPYSSSLQQRFSEVFEREVDVFPVSTGTAANSLALASITPPWGAVYCHDTAHIQTTECNAPEFYTGGAKLVSLQGDNYCISPDIMRSTLAHAGIGKPNKAQPSALSITQPTDYDTVYPLEHIRELSDIAHGHQMAVHMDGARLANAIHHLGCSPAQTTWKAGVDILSLGATKNGAMFAEAIVVFDRKLSANLEFRCRRAGHVWSKMRYATAQLQAYVCDDLWLNLASQANAAASRLAEGLSTVSSIEIMAPVQVNILQLRMPEPVIDALESEGYLFYRRSSTHIRLVCRYDTSIEEVDALISAVARINESHALSAQY